jgi:chorismate synthase
MLFLLFLQFVVSSLGQVFAASRMFGSEHNDSIENIEGKTTTNHAGGVVGGITNGNEMVFRIAIKPTSSTH